MADVTYALRHPGHPSVGPQPLPGDHPTMAGYALADAIWRAQNRDCRLTPAEADARCHATVQHLLHLGEQVPHPRT